MEISNHPKPSHALEMHAIDRNIPKIMSMLLVPIFSRFRTRNHMFRLHDMGTWVLHTLGGRGV